MGLVFDKEKEEFDKLLFVHGYGPRVSHSWVKLC